jgi:hypothetical protein
VNSLRLQTGTQYWRRLAVIWGLFGLIGLAITAVARQPLLGVLGLLLMVAPAYMLWSRRAWWVARMDGDGVTLLSGKRFAWSGFEKVFEVNARRYGATWHSHYELVFKDGHARVFDRMLKNSDEVMPVLQALGRGERPFAAAGP